MAILDNIQVGDKVLVSVRVGYGSAQNFFSVPATVTRTTKTLVCVGDLRAKRCGENADDKYIKVMKPYVQEDDETGEMNEYKEREELASEIKNLMTDIKHRQNNHYLAASLLKSGKYSELKEIRRTLIKANELLKKFK